MAASSLVGTLFIRTTSLCDTQKPYHSFLIVQVSTHYVLDTVKVSKITRQGFRVRQAQGMTAFKIQQSVLLSLTEVACSAGMEPACWGPQVCMSVWLLLQRPRMAGRVWSQQWLPSSSTHSLVSPLLF